MAASSGGEDSEDEEIIRSINSLVPYYRHMDEEFISSIASGHEVKREMMQQCNYDGSTLPGICIKFTWDV